MFQYVPIRSNGCFGLLIVHYTNNENHLQYIVEKSAPLQLIGWLGSDFPLVLFLHQPNSVRSTCALDMSLNFAQGLVGGALSHECNKWILPHDGEKIKPKAAARAAFAAWPAPAAHRLAGERLATDVVGPPLRELIVWP
ncbi:MAG: hypothetical protein LBR77_06190 [Lachnospiraceae bacterium]|jgi:hypothetical protein|nr:hypothetical protein [Lachnospiraceae bacterium]